MRPNLRRQPGIPTANQRTVAVLPVSLSVCFSLCFAFDLSAQPPLTEPREEASFLFMGDQTTTYVFRGRELQRRQTSQQPPAADTLRPLPTTAITDSAGVFDANAESRFEQQLQTLRTATELDVFIVTASETTFEDVAWELLETLRHDVQTGTPAILVFSEDATRSAALFGASAVVKFGRAFLQRATDRALTITGADTVQERVEMRLSALSRELTREDSTNEAVGTPQKLLYASTDVATPEPNAASAPAQSSTEAAADAGSETSSPREKKESELWQMASFVLIAILLPTAIIAIAIVATIARRNSAAKMTASRPPRARPLEPTPLSATSGIPERRVKTPPPPPHLAHATPLDTLPRSSAIRPEETEFSASLHPSHPAHPLNPSEHSAAGGPVHFPARDTFVHPPLAQTRRSEDSQSQIQAGIDKREFRSKTPSPELEQITFAPGEREKIGELLATLKLLQAADDDTRPEILEMIRALVAEIKQLTLAATHEAQPLATAYAAEEP